MPASIKLLVVSDLHGSNACFKKTLGLISEVHPDALIIAGDFIGKRSVFYEQNGRGLVTFFEGNRGKTLPYQKADTFKQVQADQGTYFIKGPPAETEPEIAKLEAQAASRRLEQWFDYGRTKYSQASVFLIPGNDDVPELVEILDGHPWVHNLDMRQMSWGTFLLFGLGYSNETPWHTPRELNETDITAKLRTVAYNISDWDRAIGVIHVPPFHTGLDDVPELASTRGGELRPTGLRRIPSGSTAVRSFIEQFQPLLLVSGHCHSSWGACKLSRTTCVNPGSAFDSGVLFARIICIEQDRIATNQRLVR